MTGGAELRPAIADEFDVVAALAERLGLSVDLKRESGLAQSRQLVCLVNGEIVGFSLFWILSTEAELLDIGIAPEYQRRGLARRLLGATLTQAMEEGATKVFLEVRAKNGPAIRLYERASFVVSFVRKGYYQDGEDALVYEYAAP